MIATGTPKTSRSALPFEIQQNNSASEEDFKTKASNIAETLYSSSLTFVYSLNLNIFSICFLFSFGSFMFCVLHINILYFVL